VQQFRNRLFVLLGVNEEPSREALQRVAYREQLPWRNWWDGPGGALAAAWGVEVFPTFFLIDRQGVIRFKHVGVPPPGSLEEEIEQLVREVEEGAPAG
jgi:hypothetical protein